MATPTIPNGEKYFFPIIYSGNGQGQRIGKFVPFTDNGTIANSVIYNRSDNPKLTRTPSSNGNRKTFTISVWYKPTDLGTRRILCAADTSGSDYGLFELNENNKLYWTHSSVGDIISTRTFEDTSKFYHFMLAVDTTQSTASDRVKLYADGNLITSLDSSTYPSQDFQTNFNSTSYPIAAGTYNSLTGYATGGYLAEFNFVDGQALLPASFGVTDTSTGRWIPKTVSPYPTTTTDIAVTVVSSGGNKYALDGVTQGTVTLIEGATYKFDQSDSSNATHPLRFSTTSDGTHGGGSEFTSGVTTVGTPGSSGAYTQITVPTGTATLYYYCSSHSGMGGTANTQDQYGTNGFRLKFQDSSALGDDTSGNGNDLTSTNLATTDQRTDSPTNLFPTIRVYNPSYSQTFSEGNLQHATTGTNVGYPVVSTLRPKGSGKFYAECRISDTPGGYTIALGCYAQEDLHNYSSGNAYVGNANYGSGLWIAGTNYFRFNGQNGFGDTPTFTFSAGDVIGLALDLDTGLLSFYDDDNGLIGSVTYDRTKSACFGAMSNKAVTFIWNFGDNPTFNGNETAGGNTDGDGNGNFFKSVPTGFKVLKQDNMAETAKGVSGLVWTKNRDATDNHQLYDSSRGKQLVLASNATSAESTVTDGLQKFLAGGQQIEDSDAINTAGESFVTWNWVANAGTTSSNTDGSITSTVQVNTDAGFSIVQRTGTGSAGTVGHGLGKAPAWIFSKNLSVTESWPCWHQSITAAKVLFLNSNGATSTSPQYNTTAPTSTVFSVGATDGNNKSGSSHIDYVWCEVDGFSKFGKFVGNGNADGPFIYTGFKPRWIMFKETGNTNDWPIWDSARFPLNPTNNSLFADLSQGDNGSSIDLDVLSNGFKCRTTNSQINRSGGSYIYMAFAEHPFVGDGTNPVTAR